MILVIGASGTVGRAVTSELRALGAPFILSFSTSEKAAAARVAGDAAVTLDCTRDEGLAEGFRGIETVFLVSGSVPDQAGVETRAVEAAASAGVRRIVKLSVIGAADESFSFARWHRPVERAIERSGMAWTFLRPNGFMQNVVTYMSATIRSQAAMYVCGATVPISHVDVRDVAAVAARALTEPRHAGAAYTLTGPAAITYEEMARAIGLALGRAVTAVDLTLEAYRQGAIDYGIPAWYADALVDLSRFYMTGAAAATTGTIREVLGREPIGFDRFLADHLDVLRAP